MSGYTRHSKPVRGDVALIDLADCGPIRDAEPTDRETWEAQAETAILAHAALGTAFTTYDVARIHALPEPPDHHLWGLLMQRLHAAGDIAPVGWSTSHRPASNSSGVRVWIGTTSIAEAA